MNVAFVVDYQATINHLDTLPTVLAQLWVMENYSMFNDQEMLSLWNYCKARAIRYRTDYKKVAEEDAILNKKMKTKNNKGAEAPLV